MVLTSFISIFISKPIKIYKKAIQQLNNNQYGTTINSFSKDEFDNITKAFNEMSIAIKQKEQIKRYVSEKLIESVDINQIQQTEEGKTEMLTILSSDIRNFTGISEIKEPNEIVEMLNTYFTKMQQAISANGGIIDKYIGDAIQAVFYDEPDKESHILRSAKAALDMRKALDEFNKERKESGLFTIENGIGIDTDIAITGTIGSKNGRKDYSVNGEVIARAASLEAKTKATKSKILISKKSLKELDSRGISYLAITNSETDNLATNLANKSVLFFKEFDEESVELIDVK
jgi:adenylate cyclase